jgi:signal transduction histidine kinase
MAATVDDEVDDLRRANAELRQRLDEALAERDEGEGQKAAMAEVLEVINSSPSDLAPVFDAILERAMRLCGIAFASLHLHDGGNFQAVALRGMPDALAELLRQPYEPGEGAPSLRLLAGERFVQIADMAASARDRPQSARAQITAEQGLHTALFVPLRKDTDLLGHIAAYRREVQPYTEKQIALLENFAAQAVIAIENARLITETREALDQQTATAEVLQVINSSPGNLAPVFEAMLDKALYLCEVPFGGLWTFDGEQVVPAVLRGVSPAMAEFYSKPFRPTPGRWLASLISGSPFVHVSNISLDEGYQMGAPAVRALVDLGDFHSTLMVPLRKGGAFVGVICLYAHEARPFADKQIALLQNFAAQAVIAMENARLITETREALDQQTATAEVLGVINSSPGDLAPVFDAMLEKAMRLCDAAFGSLWANSGDRFLPIAHHGVPAPYAEYLAREVPAAGPGTGRARLLAGEPFAHIADLANEEPYRAGEPHRRALVDLGGARSALLVPLRKDEAVIGFIMIYRQEVQPFTDKQIALLQNFAAQAVIAMENARLITETREALEQQTATSEVLGVINSSPGNLTPVFEAILEKAHNLCGVTYGSLQLYDGYKFHAVAVHDLPEALADQLRQGYRPRPGLPNWALLEGESFVQVSDMATVDDPIARTTVENGIRTLLWVALRKDDALLGNIAAARREVRPFTDKEIALLQNFAAQAVIAMENARLITETREARDDAQAALGHLKAAQANLIQAEKMASLGQLTAGIAHEIKNPLNFVNNFASLSVELLDELKETTAPALAALDDEKRAEADDTMELLTGNLEKIAEHGKRADNIVKSMLEHSRGATGERREVDLNGLIDEALNLAYHGARAQDQTFNITLERDFDQALPQIELAPQEITRVFLNLFGNGFYAANKRAREDGDRSFRPALTVATRGGGDAVEVTVRDNGTGIPPEIKDKLFQPFFTTKPTGEGTGLGLSISYDIITQQHGGTITVESEPGSFTEFTVRLPRHQPQQ